MADKARRDIWWALWNLATSDGVQCSRARRKELKFTCKMRADWTGSSGLRQEHFQVSWCDPDSSWMLIGNYEACIKNLLSYLVCWGSLAVAAWCIVKGRAEKVGFVNWRAEILSRNRLLRHDMQCHMKLSQDLLAGASHGVGQECAIRSTWLISVTSFIYIALGVFILHN